MKARRSIKRGNVLLMVVPAIIGLATFAQTAWALPDLKQNSAGMGKFQSFAQRQFPSLAGVSFLEDHDTHNILYVTPASRKTQAGGYRPVQSANCDLLSDQYRITYNYPRMVPSEQWASLAKTGPYSPAFDYQYGLSIFYSSALQELGRLLAELNHVHEAHKEIYGEYVAAKEAHETAQAAVTLAKTAFDSYDLKFNDLVSRMALAQTAEERQAIIAQMRALQTERTEQLPSLRDDWKKASGEEFVSRSRYQTALAAWAPYDVDTKGVKERMTSLKDIYELNRTMTLEAFNSAETLLNNFESRIVGVANAGFNVWGTEVADSSAALSQYGNDSCFRIVPLPIYNFRASTGSSVAELSGADGSGTGLGGSKMLHSHVDSGEPMGEIKKDVTYASAFRDSSGVPLLPQISDLKQGAGVLNVPVRMGVYCTGNSTRVAHDLRIKDVNDNDTAIRTYEYQPKQANKVQQAVSINYDYFAYANPINVSCSLNVVNFSSYARSSGTEGFLFWRHSWDDTQRSTVRNNGVSCQSKEAPSYMDPQQQRKFIDATEQTMMQEVMAEFVLNYAKSYTVTAATSPIPENDVGGAFNRIGTSMIFLCGGNPYCTIGSVILKSANDLFGNESGSTSNQESFRGSIYRSYARESYRVVPGSAVVNLEIELPGIALQ
ncbi:hypothetical protein WDW37_02945 [Bdellovibrionota bacterium FG-1]